MSSAGQARAQMHAPSDGPRARPDLGQRLQLQIDSLAYGGAGVARLGVEGYVVFVDGAIPGDCVIAEVYKRKRSYAHARTIEVLQASAERIAPAAQHPGVPWQVLPYQRQLQEKQRQVDEALRRIGGLSGYQLEPIVPAIEQWRYRNKLEYSFGRGEGGELVCGFHAPARWNRVLPITDCLLASPLGNRAHQIALQWARAEGLPPWERPVSQGRHHRASRRAGDGVAWADEDPARADRALAQAGDRVARPDRPSAQAGDRVAQLRNLVVREGRRTGKLQIRLVTTPGEVDAASLAQQLRDQLPQDVISGVLWTRSNQLAETTSGGETQLIFGEARLPERLLDLDLRISPEAFLQTNTEMAEVLYRLVAQYAELHHFERVYDLYSGTGMIALSLAGSAGEAWGIELSEAAVADARAAADRNGISAAQFIAGDVQSILPQLSEGVGRPDVIVVDPPRAGLSQKVVRRIIEAAPKRIVYVCCNPTTLAPNAAQLEDAGWRLTRVRPVDMFPQTHHIECVAAFHRVS